MLCPCTLRCLLSQGFFPTKQPRLLVPLSINPILLESICCQPWEAQHHLLYLPPVHDAQPQREAEAIPFLQGEAISFLGWLWVWRSRHLTAPSAWTELHLHTTQRAGSGHTPLLTGGVGQNAELSCQNADWRAVNGPDRCQPLIHPFYKNVTRLPPVDDNCTRATYISLFQKLVATVTKRVWHNGIVKEATTEPREVPVKHKLGTFYFTCTLK